jgi:hypothetical protein
MGSYCKQVIRWSDGRLARSKKKISGEPGVHARLDGRDARPSTTLPLTLPFRGDFANNRNFS